VRLAMVFHDVPILLSTLGQIQSASSQFDKAVESYEAAIAGGYDPADVWLQLGNAYASRIPRTLLRADLMRAEDCYKRASVTYPAAAFINLARLHWEYGNRVVAKYLANKALEANPTDPVVICNSIVYACDDVPGKVLDALARVERDYPNDPVVLTMIGDYNYRLADWDTAYKYFARAIQIAGNRSLVLENAYLQGSDALAKSVGGDEGRRRAVDLIKEGIARLPGSQLLPNKLSELEIKASD
jgi:tetratricopeptide (TPR) repeat protein